MPLNQLFSCAIIDRVPYVCLYAKPIQIVFREDIPQDILQNACFEIVGINHSTGEPIHILMSSQTLDSGNVVPVLYQITKFGTRSQHTHPFLKWAVTVLSIATLFM